MIACSKCGASNGLGMTECRMCGSPLTQSDVVASNVPSGDALDTTMVFKNLRTQPGTASLTECLICPECQTIGQIGWLFCPQCGKEVDASFLRTTDRPDESTTIEATMPPHAAPAQVPLQSVQVQVPLRQAHVPFPQAHAQALLQQSQVPLPPAQVPLQVVAPHQAQPEEARPSAENHRYATQFTQEPAKRQPEPLSAQPAQGWVESPPLSVMPEPPIRSSVEIRSASANSSNGGAADEPSSSAPTVEHKVTCNECGSENSSHYSFCLNCGESLPVTRTVVMASLRTQVSPRLRLLVQGESSGPTYEIKNEAVIGRTEGTITFPRDSFMSSSHARIIKRGADFMLIDEASSNGTFIKVKSETKLEPGDVILVGGQLLRYEA